MSLSATVLAWKIPGLKPRQRLVLLKLADEHSAGDIFEIDFDKLSKLLEINPSTLKDIIDELCGFGLLRRPYANLLRVQLFYNGQAV